MLTAKWFERDFLEDTEVHEVCLLWKPRSSVNSVCSPSEGRLSVPLSSPGQSSCLSPVLLVSAESDLSKSRREEQQHASS